MRPAEAGRSPAASSSRVDFPQPLGPTIATNSPLATVRSMPASAASAPPSRRAYSLDVPSKRILIARAGARGLRPERSHGVVHEGRVDELVERYVAGGHTVLNVPGLLPLEIEEIEARISIDVRQRLRDGRFRLVDRPRGDRDDRRARAARRPAETRVEVVAGRAHVSPHEPVAERVVAVQPRAVEHAGHLIDDPVARVEQNLAPAVLLRGRAPRRGEQRRVDLAGAQRLGDEIDLAQRHQLNVPERQGLALEELRDLVMERRAERRDADPLPAQVPQRPHARGVRRLRDHDGVERIAGTLLPAVGDEIDLAAAGGQVEEGTGDPGRADVDVSRDGRGGNRRRGAEVHKLDLQAFLAEISLLGAWATAPGTVIVRLRTAASAAAMTSRGRTDSSGMVR